MFVFTDLLFFEVGMDKLIGWKHPRMHYLNWDGRVGSLGWRELSVHTTVSLNCSARLCSEDSQAGRELIDWEIGKGLRDWIEAFKRKRLGLTD